MKSNPKCPKCKNISWKKGRRRGKIKYQCQTCRAMAQRLLPPKKKKKFTDCSGKFRRLNGKTSLEITKKTGIDLPVFF